MDSLICKPAAIPPKTSARCSACNKERKWWQGCARLECGKRRGWQADHYSIEHPKDDTMRREDEW